MPLDAGARLPVRSHVGGREEQEPVSLLGRFQEIDVMRACAFLQRNWVIFLDRQSQRKWNANINSYYKKYFTAPTIYPY